MLKANKHRGQKEQYLADYCALVENGTPQAMLLLAKERDYQPYLLARLILTAILDRWPAAVRQNKDILKEWARSPEQIDLDCELLDPPMSLDLKVLRVDVQLSIEHDDSYGPLVDTMKQNVGLEYVGGGVPDCVRVSFCFGGGWRE